jgi:putative oxidoreductase
LIRKRKDRSKARRVVLRTMARVLLSGVFVQGGWSTFWNPGRRPQQAAKLGIAYPNPATTLTRINGLAMVMGGAALAMGVMPRASAAMLGGSLVPTTVAGHRFWEQPDEQGRRQHTIHFLKNLAILGGLLAVIAEE